MRLSVAVPLLVLSVLIGPRQMAHAYVREPWTWEKRVLTYSVPPELQAYAVEAMATWSAYGDIQFKAGGHDVDFVHVEPSVAARAQMAPKLLCRNSSCQAPYDITHCEIRAGAQFFAEPDAQRTKLLVHELGHCLGLDHTSEASIMSVLPIGGLTWSGDDVRGIQSLYGPSSRIGWNIQRVPLVASDR